MLAIPRVRASLDEVWLAEALLGPDDPLVGSLQRQAVAIEQLCSVGAVLALSGFGIVGGVAAAIPFALASAVVAIWLAVRVELCVLDRRDAVLDLLIAGRADVSLDVVRCERARLLDRSHRETLARSFESIGSEPDARSSVPSRACVVVVVSAVRHVRPELATVAALLRDDRASVRGVAAAHRLMTTGGSSLFGRDHEILRQDLRRIASLLRG